MIWLVRVRSSASPTPLTVFLIQRAQNKESKVIDLTLSEIVAPAKVLKDLILHHAEEEEKEMFPRATKILGKERLKELGAELEKHKLDAKNALSSTLAGSPGRRRQTPEARM